MKRPLSRLRLTPRGRLRRNVVLLLLLPLALLLVLRPCFTHQAALERLQSRFHFGPVDAAQWYPEEAIYALRYDRWYAVCSLERQPFFLGQTWRPDARGLIAAPVEDAPLSVCGIHYLHRRWGDPYGGGLSRQRRAVSLVCPGAASNLHALHRSGPGRPGAGALYGGAYHG